MDSSLTGWEAYYLKHLHHPDMLNYILLKVKILLLISEWEIVITPIQIA